MSQKLVELRRVNYSLGQRPILRDITWSLERGQHWGVLGGNGAGKSTFLRLVRGEIWPRADGGRRLYANGGQAGESPLAFRQISSLVSPELLDIYQRRQWNLSLWETVCAGIADAVYLTEPPSPKQEQAAREALAQVGLVEMQEEPLLRLSRGQMKRALIARALVRRPQVLLLDEVGEDMDQASRRAFMELLERLAREGVTLLCASHRRDELPSALTHLLILGEGRILAQGARPAVEGTAPDFPRAAQAAGDPPAPRAGQGGQAFVARIRRADVFRQRRRILRQVDWTILPGQHWALTGDNGAGKTTLLKLLGGELSPALGGEVAWFGEAGRPGQSDLRGRVSLVSADLQARHFRPAWRGLDMVVGGLQGSVGPSAPPRPQDLERASAWLEALGLEALAGRSVAGLSYGELRKLLIARAAVIRPALLLLDEPLAGLDQEAKAGVGALLERLALGGASLVMVSHHAEDLPSFLTHAAVVARGRLAFTGTMAQYLAREKAGGPAGWSDALGRDHSMPR